MKNSEVAQGEIRKLKQKRLQTVFEQPYEELPYLSEYQRLMSKVNEYKIRLIGRPIDR